jgi:EmrB/QacA subfamily drug resistance transporter
MDRKWRALIVVCVAIFMLLLDITVVNVALPDIQKELHTSFTDLQWVVDAYALMLASVMLNAGSLGDWLGRKRVFLAGIGLFTIASALCGSATSPLFLNLARGAQGIGGAIMFAVSLAILAQEFHGRERGTAFGIWGATIGASVAIGPLVGGALTEWAGWRWIFFVNLPIGVLCILLGAQVLHESRDEHHRGFDPVGFVTFTGGLFALVLFLLRGNDWHWSSGREITLLVASIVLLIVFTLYELRRSEPMFDVRLFRVPTFTGAQIIAFGLAAGMFSMFLYLALYMQNVLHLSPIATGVRFLPLSIVSFFTAPIAGRMMSRVPIRLLFGVGLALVGVALLLMHGVSVDSQWTTLLAGFIVGGIGVGMVNAPLAATAVSVVEARRAGMASGINNTFRQVGIATGIAALGALLQSKAGSPAAASGRGDPQAFVNGMNEILLVAAIVLFVAAVLAAALVRRSDFVASGPQQGQQQPQPAGAEA